jgi:hypothetical protein
MAGDQGILASLKLRTLAELAVITFLTTVGISVVFVIGSIVLRAVHNHGLIPPADIADAYTCSSGSTMFTLRYSHGSDHVQIRSESGVLYGLVNQNRIEWLNFTNDATQLGFLPPVAITFEDKKSIHVSALDGQGTQCAIAAQHSGHRRQITP